MKTALILLVLFGLVQLPTDFFQFSGRYAQPSNVRMLPKGVTVLYEPIILKSGESLIGNDTTLILADGANCPMIIVGDINPDPQTWTESVSISSIHLIGNKDNQQWEGWLGDPAHKEHSIRNNGITVRKSRGVVINNVEVSDCRSGGIVLERGSEDIMVINSSSTDNFFDGFAAYESTRVFCYNLDLSDNHFAGISLDLHFDFNVIVNCRIARNLREGIFMRHSSHNIFDRITFSDNAGYPIFLAQSELPDSAAKSNMFFACSFPNRKEIMKINDSTCTNNFLIDSEYKIDNLISTLK